MTDIELSLLKRFRHLLQSDFIRSFDEWDPKKGDYKRDIREADACIRKDCDHCEYKQFKERTLKLHDRNDCGVVRSCPWRPLMNEAMRNMPDITVRGNETVNVYITYNYQNENGARG